jgi:lysophospholipase L1-like esterase
MKFLRRASSLFVLLLLLMVTARPQQPDTSTNPWEKEIRQFEKADSLRPPPKGAILFVGSSSIRMWETLAEDFPGLQVINRGFGGSELSDAVHFADRIILPYKPKKVIVYAGDNDLANGKTPEQILADYKQLVQLIHRNLPGTWIGYISIKPSLARWNLVEKIRKTNSLIREYASRDRPLSYIDVFTPMLDKQGTPRKELFAPDGLHLNREGYRLWKQRVRPAL